MKLNRMRMALPAEPSRRIDRGWGIVPGNRDFGSVDLRSMGAPPPIQKPSPDQVVEDIVVSTLLKVQDRSSPEIQAAAQRMLTMFRPRA